MKVMLDGAVLDVAEPLVLASEIAARVAAVAARRLLRDVEISSFDFFNRFTDAEKLAVQIAAASSPQIALGLTHGLAKGSVTLTGAVLGAWMNGLVAAGAITADRKAIILTP